MPYSIFTLQPVKNAHIYLFRHLLMDYPDTKVVEILKSTVSAMGPESRLIINEMLVPDRVTVGDQQMVHLFDIMLLAMSGRERSLSEYRRIFGGIGLELLKEHRSEGSQTIMLETRLKARKAY